MTWALLLAGLAVRMAQAAPPEPASQPVARVEIGITATIETYCSTTKLRTTNARIRWSMPLTLDANGGSGASVQSLETTVYKNGFEKGLWVALPLTANATAERPIAARAATQERQPIRAFQIRLIGVEQSKETISRNDEGPPAAEMTAIVENLEPGVNYTWRVAMDTPAGKVVSPAVRVLARVCPADMAPPRNPRRKP